MRALERGDGAVEVEIRSQIEAKNLVVSAGVQFDSGCPMKAHAAIEREVDGRTVRYAAASRDN